MSLIAIPRVGSGKPAKEVGTWLDLTPRVDSSNPETGLLSFAFHPNFVNNGRFFVSYICDARKVPDCKVSELAWTSITNQHIQQTSVQIRYAFAIPPPTFNRSHLVPDLTPKKKKCLLMEQRQSTAFAAEHSRPYASLESILGRLSELLRF